MPGGLPLPEHLASLVGVLACPQEASALSLDQWDLVVRVSRGAKLAAALCERLRAGPGLQRIPDRPATHLRSEHAVAEYQAQMVRLELRQVELALRPLAVPVVLLKGAAYLLQDRPWARGRMLSDVDLLVPRDRLDAVEGALLAAGWTSEVSDPYDQRYYRVWAHELPPMVRAGAALEIDLHHTLLPVSGRVHPNTSALFEAAEAIPGSGFRALCREDQILHSAAHLFQDSDCADRLRDLVDLDGMLRELGTEDAAWRRLLERTELHELGRPLWYAVRFSQALLGTPVPSAIVGALQTGAPGAVAGWLMDRLVPSVLLPGHPDRLPPFRVQLSGFLLYLRSMWLRMPPLVLLPHLGRKAWRRLVATRQHVAGAEGLDESAAKE
jgi:hypothetical protein